MIFSGLFPDMDCQRSAIQKLLSITAMGVDSLDALRPRAGAPEPPRHGPGKVVERLCDRPSESRIRRPRRPKKAARSGDPAPRVLDGPRGSVHRRYLAAVGLHGASMAMRARHLGVREEPKGIIMRETDEGGRWVLRVGKGTSCTALAR